MRRILTISIAVALLATACGDSGGSLSSANWCDTARVIEVSSNAFDSPTPDNIRLFSQQVSDARGSAPAEIKDDVKLLSEFLQIMVKAVDDNDGNIILAFDSMTTELNDPKYSDAGDRITAYNERECGIVDTNASDTSSADGTSTDTGNGTTDTLVPPGGIVAGLADSFGITEDQARCLVSNFDFTSSQDPSVSDMISVFADCGIDPSILGG